MTAPSPSGAAASQCEALVDSVPETVAGQSSRTLSTPSDFAAAWGDPPVVLRCGAAAPAALTPTSRCFVVVGIGWLVTQDGREVDPTVPFDTTLEFTTIGRSPYVDLVVPADYQPAADVLVDLAPSIRRHTRQRSACQ